MSDKIPFNITEEEKERVRKQYSHAVHFVMTHNPPDAWEERCAIFNLEHLFGKDFFKDK